MTAVIENYDAVMAKIATIEEFQTWAIPPMANVVEFGAKLFAEEPGPVRYPIAWTSERQRRAFFATDGFGRGIPTGRSGALSRGWQHQVVARNFDVSGVIENLTPYGPFVQGRQQQGFHANTGWSVLDVDPLRDKLEEEFAAAVRRLIYS